MLENGELQKARKWLRIIAGLVMIAVFVWLVFTGQLAGEFVEHVLWLVMGTYLFGDGVAKQP